MDYSLPRSSAHRIFQARVLEWGAIAFSNNETEKEKKKKVFLLDSVGSLPGKGVLISSQPGFWAPASPACIFHGSFTFALSQKYCLAQSIVFVGPGLRCQSLLLVYLFV